MTEQPQIKRFRPFLVAGPDTFGPCCEFYSDLGFEMLWRSDVAAEFDTKRGEQRFLLTLHHGLVPTRVGVLHIWVDDVDAWHAHVRQLELEKTYASVRVSEPEITDWNWRLFYVWDPAGTLLHIGKPLEKPDH